MYLILLKGMKMTNRIEKNITQIFENTYKSSNECIEDYMNLRDAFEKFFS